MLHLRFFNTFKKNQFTEHAKLRGSEILALQASKLGYMKFVAVFLKKEQRFTTPFCLRESL